MKLTQPSFSLPALIAVTLAITDQAMAQATSGAMEPEAALESVGSCRGLTSNPSSFHLQHGQITHPFHVGKNL
jgi:hypothetical protein